VVEFVLVSVLVVFMVLALLQLALTLHVRNVMMSSASEGARFAALADRSLGDGARRTHTLLSTAFAGMPAEVAAQETDIDGTPGVTVTVNAPVPVVGLWGFGTISVEGRAYREEAYG
jgi:hypothetical protein